MRCRHFPVPYRINSVHELRGRDIQRSNGLHFNLSMLELCSWPVFWSHGLDRMRKLRNRVNYCDLWFERLFALRSRDLSSGHWCQRMHELRCGHLQSRYGVDRLELVFQLCDGDEVCGRCKLLHELLCRPVPAKHRVRDLFELRHGYVRCGFRVG